MNMPTARPPKRQSCDRCHAQKLRCSKGNVNGDRCTRCFRQNAECVYSTSLPKGRPSTHRLQLAGGNISATRRESRRTGTGNSGNGNTSETVSGGVTAGSTAIVEVVGNGGTSDIQAGLASITTTNLNNITNSNTNNNSNSISNANAKANNHHQMIQSPENLTPPSLSDRDRDFPSMPTPTTTTWEREHGLLTAPFSSPNGNDAGISLGEGDAWPWDSDPYYWPDWVGSDLSNSNSNSNSCSVRPLPALTPPSTSHSLTGLSSCHGLNIDTTTAGTTACGSAASLSIVFNSNLDSNSGSESEAYGHSHSHSRSHSHSHTASTTRSGADFITSGADAALSSGTGTTTTIQGCITQLSELLTRLSLAFAAAQQELLPGPHSLVAHTAFDSLATLLVSPNVALPNPVPGGGGGGGNAVRDTFSASQRLLEILHCLQRLQCEEDSGGGGGDGEMDLDSPLSLAPPHTAPTPPPRSPGSRTRSQHSDTVVHHLVLACHSLLLNIYGPLLVALHHDAVSGTDAEDGSGSGSGTRKPSLVDMRLVLLVQLCSYFIDRLHKGVSRCCLQTTTEMLEGDIQGKLRRLREVLGI